LLVWEHTQARDLVYRVLNVPVFIAIGSPEKNQESAVDRSYPRPADAYCRFVDPLYNGAHVARTSTG
jgi:hypothetical protein